MKKFLLIILILSYILIGVKAAENEALCDKYVRLHILANSNSSFDQGVKIKVKNYLLETYREEFQSFTTKEETLNFVKNNKEKIKNDIDLYLKKNNINYLSDIKITKENYKKGSFKNVKLPYGEYDSVKILLGKGKGKNLFFIMFPALSIKEGVTIKSDNSGKIKYKSKIIEILKAI